MYFFFPLFLFRFWIVLKSDSGNSRWRKSTHTHTPPTRHLVIILKTRYQTQGRRQQGASRPRHRYRFLNWGRHVQGRRYVICFCVWYLDVCLLSYLVEPLPDCSLAVTSLSRVGYLLCLEEALGCCQCRRALRWGDDASDGSDEVGLENNESVSLIRPSSLVVWCGCPVKKKETDFATNPSFSSANQLGPNSSFWAVLCSSILIGWSGFFRR